MNTSEIKSRPALVLRRARKVIPKEACITLFNAMVLPLFDYCCVVWDGCGQGNKNYLDRLLKRAAGIIAGCKATDTDIQQTLKWPSLQCRREHQKCIQVYKCINGLAPAYLLDDFHSSEQIHNYDTRNKDLIRLPLAKTTKFQTPFKYNAAKSWNTLPRNLRHDQSLTSFKLRVKKPLNHLS